ncbi:Nematode fatty acid retinoid binding family-containing protein [Strongyloides ratti]|uniref:Nematode fatty acid retinoid binding family-containing protein n=1 Tax=Strongyloides ratti TaxID=34506 RepID=A0A090LL39_STRRB|nr:Nematode fatty acid retinoid binding family-containing protein [Strongyloides ratti]CEF68235.1 Nematode fatty acid retinoid binding family-containing protein [Strongyloides ratti]
MLISLLPNELIEFYENLTVREKKLLDRMSEKREKYMQDYETSQIFQSVYPKLLEKIVNIYGIMREKIKKLPEEPRVFFYQMMEISKDMRLGENGKYEDIKRYVTVFSTKFKNLSSYAQETLIKEYPLIKILSTKDYFNEIINNWLKEKENLLKFKRVLRFLFLIS